MQRQTLNCRFSKTIPPSATEGYHALSLVQFACLICAFYQIRYRDPINSTNCSQSTIQTTNDPAPTLTTTNHLHIPTLFMHQTLCPNLDLPMATWALGPYIIMLMSNAYRNSPTKAQWTIWQPCTSKSSGGSGKKCKLAATLQLLFMNWHRHFIEQVIEAMRMPSVFSPSPIGSLALAEGISPLFCDGIESNLLRW